jgi:hypothetical protein
MSPIIKEGEGIKDLSDDEMELVAGGATYTKKCSVDKDGNGWCFLKED